MSLVDMFCVSLFSNKLGIVKFSDHSYYWENRHIDKYIIIN